MPSVAVELPALRAATTALQATVAEQGAALAEPPALRIAARQAALQEESAADLTRALAHTAEAGFTPEAHSGTTLCRTARGSERILEWIVNISFLDGRTPLEYYVKTGNRQLAGWWLDRGHAQPKVWVGKQSWWRHALFEVPPVMGDFYSDELKRQWPLWPVPADAALARAMLIQRVGGAPHGGFVMLRQVYPYYGFGPRIVGSLAAWRAANPGALVADVSDRTDLTDADFVHLAGIKALWMTCCNQATITDAAFAHLSGIHTLYMGGCNQATITDAAFAHLSGIHTLNMSNCNQATITGAAFAHLQGLCRLDVTGCLANVIAAAPALA